MATHRVLALIDRDGNDDERHAIAVLLMRHFHPRQQRGADRTPRRPEFDDDRLLADPPRQRHRIAVEILEGDGRGRITNGDTDDVLRAKRGRSEEQECDARRTTHHARAYHTRPALTR